MKVSHGNAVCRRNRFNLAWCRKPEKFSKFRTILYKEVVWKIPKLSIFQKCWPTSWNWLSPIINMFKETNTLQKKAKWQRKNAIKTSITHRLRTDVGRSVGVATATLGLTGLLDPNIPTNRKSSVIKRTHSYF